MAKNKTLARVTSLADLRTRATTDPRYLALAVAAAQNLGGTVPVGNKRQMADTTSPEYDRALRAAMDWLRINAQETGDDAGLIEEVNDVRDLV
jgi:hypothetical protein